MSDVALEIPLRPLAFGRCRERDDARDPRTQAFGDPLDGPTLPGGITTLEDHHDLQAGVADPFLELHELDLEVGELLEIDLVREPRLRDHGDIRARRRRR